MSLALLLLCACSLLLPWQRLPAWYPVRACVAVAVVAAQTVSSILQAAPGAMVARRIVLWSALGALIAVAVHGLRDRIRGSLAANAALQAEVSLARERDRIAADLRESAVRKIFDAGLALHGTAAMIGEGPAQERLMRGVAELDGAIRVMRESVFDLGHHADSGTDTSDESEPDDHR
ncbi:hypothetical protein [Streptomyces chartreusis]|uniref:hypothetical protein n=1 Tax=Streptomyces chartreusis TaxID=1969 RepID=UPI00386DC996|nr:hypothetical protein OG938_00135 [Streptomyces chartreusis]